MDYHVHRPQPAVSAPTACSKSSIVTFAILVIIAFFHSLPPQPSTQLSHPTMSVQNTPLAAWLQTRLGALYEAHPAPDDAAFAAQFDAVFARDAKESLTPNATQRTTLIVAGVYIIAIFILWCVLLLSLAFREVGRLD